MTWRAGEVIVLREVLDGRIRSARPLTVVDDGPDGLAGYMAPRSEVAWPRLVDGAQSQTPDQGWRLSIEEWQGPGCLFLLPSGEAYAAVLFLERDSGDPLGWKVDFLAPPIRTAVGLDTLDWALDLLAPADLSSWSVKDEDDLAQLERLRLLGVDGPARVRAARARAEAALAGRRPPFTGPTARWRPPPGGLDPLRLPAGWDQVDASDPVAATQVDGPSAPAGPRTAGAPRELRSGRGVRVLDATGRTLLDLDLAGGSLLHGHAHPAVVDAVSRQLGLGLGVPSAPGAGPGERALVEALAERVPASGSLRWTADGEAAWWLAVGAAVRATGRSHVAAWTPPVGEHGRTQAAGRLLPSPPPAPTQAAGRLLPSPPPAPTVVLLPTDPADACAELSAAGVGLAAVVVDPLVVGLTPPPHRDTLLAALERLASEGVLLVADERRCLGAGPAGGHGRLDVAVSLVVYGPSLFAGLGGGAVGGPAELLDPSAAPTVAGRRSGPAGRIPRLVPGGGGLHPVLAAAGLATLALADAATLDDLGHRADRLAAALGVTAFGAAVPLPPGTTATDLAARGLLVDRSGWAWLATVGSRADDDAALSVLASAGGR